MDSCPQLEGMTNLREDGYPIINVGHDGVGKITRSARNDRVPLQGRNNGCRIRGENDLGERVSTDWREVSSDEKAGIVV